MARRVKTRSIRLDSEQGGDDESRRADDGEELSEDVLERTMWIDPGKVGSGVQDGRAAMSGRLDRRSDVELLNRLVARIPGSTRKGRRSMEQPVR